MSGHASSSRILSSGLQKALVEECIDAFQLIEDMIHEETSSAPAEMLSWRKGSFSWVFVKAVEYWFDRFTTELSEMAAKNGKKQAGNRGSLEAYSFVRCELNAEDKKSAKEWIDKNAKGMPAKVHDLVASDYKVSISYDSNHDTFIASATGKEGSLNQFKTMTSRHKDWSMALFSLLYKHEVIFSSGIWENDDMEDDGWS